MSNVLFQKILSRGKISVRHGLLRLAEEYGRLPPPFGLADSSKCRVEQVDIIGKRWLLSVQ